LASSSVYCVLPGAFLSLIVRVCSRWSLRVCFIVFFFKQKTAYEI